MCCGKRTILLTSRLNLKAVGYFNVSNIDPERVLRV